MTTRAGTTVAQRVVDLRVEAVRWVAEDVITVELVSLEAVSLAPWTPGAHLDVELPSGRRRQYSLCGDPADRGRYRIAVQREDGGRGASRELHDTALVGRIVRIHAVENRFPVQPASAYLFLADGIGIAPILAMARHVSQQRTPWGLVYSGRTLSAMAFVDELCRLPGGRVELMPQDESGPPDFTRILAAAGRGVEVYACGPDAMLGAVLASGGVLGSGRLHVQHVEEPGAAPSPGSPTGHEIRDL